MQERLIEIGRWLQINGEGIYETHRTETPSILSENQQLYFTCKSDALYVFFSKWTSEIRFPWKKDKPTNATLLGTDFHLDFELKDNELIINIPRLPIDEIPCLHLWGVKIE
jgi:alpha-L-fucosidase